VTHVPPRNHLLDIGTDPPREVDTFEGAHVPAHDNIKAYICIMLNNETHL